MALAVAKRAPPTALISTVGGCEALTWTEGDVTAEDETARQHVLEHPNTDSNALNTRRSTWNALEQLPGRLYPKLP